MNPTYGPFVKLRRIGKNGEIINVFKMRTMHPYAEYLQHYIHEKHDLAEGGKIKDDFRVTTLGKLMRTLWIDELPMILNWLIGDVKLVGVRPLSKHYFSLYDKELQELRIKTKPGTDPSLLCRYAENTCRRSRRANAATSKPTSSVPGEPIGSTSGKHWAIFYSDMRGRHKQ